MESLNGIQLGNGIFFRDIEIKKGFLEESKKWPSSLVKGDVDNAFINNWIEDKTGLRDVFKSQSWKVSLVNTIFFDKKWEHKLDQELVQFTSFDGVERKVGGMADERMVKYGKHDNFDFIELDYIGGEYHMVFVRPGTGYETVDLDFITQSGKHQKVDIKIPVFKIDSNHNIKHMISCSADKSCAQFDKISKEKLFVEDASQVAKIEVTESGTKAVAATVVSMVIESAVLPDPPDQVFHITKPFEFYLIHKESNLFLFAGRVNKLK